jgi:hypothetical protein
MTDRPPQGEPLDALIEDYLTGRIDEPRLQELEARLRDDPEARRAFVRYARLHTDLHFELRARQASERVMEAIDRQTRPAPRPAVARRHRYIPAAVAAGVLIAAGLAWWAVRPPAAVAWLVNAQNCTWAGGDPPAALRPGQVLEVERGLAEFRFRGGARVVLQGPARVTLLSGTSVRLDRGTLAARVTGTDGFEVLSPQGKVIDRGTEFGVAVSGAGATEVIVFEGKVEVRPSAGDDTVSLTRNQGARIAAGKVTVEPDADPGRFVRAIVPPPVATPRTLRLTFDRVAAVGVRDADGRATGFTHRLPGTGFALPEHDLNLRLNADKNQFELTTTDSDLNTQHRLGRGEYVGVRLADLGFTGTEDFEVSATFPAIPALDGIGQLGLYAGARSDRNIRGGVLVRNRKVVGQYTQFLVLNPAGNDINRQDVGVLADGTDLRLTLRRVGGKFSLTIEKLTDGFASTLTARETEFLDAETDLYVGVFGANAQGKVQGTLAVKEFQATVWTVGPRPGH